MDYRPIISGQRRDPLAFFIRRLLAVLRFPYGWVVRYRNLAYDRGWFSVDRCEVPVLSIGNLTTGGTGKTPLVRYTARLLRDNDYRVALVSRGYGAIDGGENDEAMELASSLPDVPHLQNADRAAAARVAVEELETEVIVMDDGFQHRRLARDLDILVVDATCPFGYGYGLPRGLLREPVSSARRAAIAVLTRCDAVDESQRQRIGDTLRRHRQDIVLAETVHRPTGLLRWPSSVVETQGLRGQSVAVVCAIGNPDAFVQTVRALGATVVERIELADHHPYDQETVTMIRQKLVEWGDKISHVVCTHKDLVKIQTDSIAGKPLLAVQIEIQFLGGQADFDQLVLRTVQRAERPSIPPPS